MRSPDSALAGFLATLLVHSTLWVAAAWVLARALRSAVWRARLWRGAALGGVASAALALALDTSRLEWRWEPAQAATEPRAIAIEAPADATPVLLDAHATVPASAAAPASRAPLSAARSRTSRSWTEIAVGAWVLGAVLALAHLLRERRRLARALRSRRTLHEAAWSADLADLSRRAGLRRAPRLSVVEGLSSPLALARGEIVVPARACRELARAEQRALLAHELAHVARRDPHWLLALALLERVFWFQPLLRTAARRAGAAAELCCDEAAAGWTGAGLALARCLATVATWVGARPGERAAVAMAARGSALVERVERLLAPPPERRFQGALCVIGGAGLLAALACSGPTASERERSAEAELLELLRRRIDLENTQELELIALGGGRFEITLPPVSLAQLRREAQPLEPMARLTELGYAAADPSDGDALRALGYAADLQEAHDPRLESPLALVRSCPEARLAFHVPFVEGAYARTMTAPGSFGHSFELRGDGSIWCGDMALSPPGCSDDRLLDVHLEEIARCMGNMERVQIRAHGIVIEGFELRLEDDADVGLLLRVLESCARDAVRMRSFGLVRIPEGATTAPLQIRLPADEPGSAPVEPLVVTLRVASDAGSERSLEAELSGTGAGEGLRTESLEDLARELARLRAGAARYGTALIDARPGVLYGDVAPVLAALVAAGYTDLRFAGCR